MKEIKIIVSLFFLFCFTSFVFAANVVEFNSLDDINDITKWNSLNESGSTGTICGNFEMTASFFPYTFNQQNITISSSDEEGKTLSAKGERRFFELSGVSSFTINNILFNGGTYKGNTSGGGGAIFISNSSTTSLNGKFQIEQSTSSGYGGGIYAKDAALNIDGTTSFTSNRAEVSGGAIYSDKQITFTDAGKVFLHYNSAGKSGGAVYSSGNVIIKGEVEITSNVAENNGGGIYSGGLVSFENSNITVLLSSNTARCSTDEDGAYRGGGGIYAKGEVSFNGGAYIKDNNITLPLNSTDVFCGGGAIYSKDEVSFSSKTATIKLINNNSGCGGAIFSSKTVSFEGSADIEDNSVWYAILGSSGGAICADENIEFNNSSATIKLSSNKNQKGNGGALYAGDKILFNANIEASKNESAAGDGGVLYTKSVDISSGAVFNNNTAGNNGGAIFLHNGTSTFTSSVGNDIIFRLNRASNTANDIHLGGGVTLDLYTSEGGNIIFGSGISYSTTTTGTQNTVNKKGKGTLSLTGSSFTFQTLNISSGTTIIGENNDFSVVNFNFKGSTISTDTTVLNMRNENTENIIKVGNLFTATGGKIYLDINSNTGQADKISAENAKLSKTEQTYIKIGVAGVSPETKKYTIFESTTGTGTLIIDNTNSEGKTMNRVSSQLYYWNGVDSSTAPSSHWNKIDIEVTIDQLNAIEGLSENQKQVALALDGDYGTATGDLFETIDELDITVDVSEKKKALTSLSGHVLANAVTLAGLNTSKDSVLSRLKKSYFIPDDSLIKRNVWAQAYASGNKYKGDKNSPDDFKSSNNGFQAGFDTMKDDSRIFGLSLGYVDMTAKQNSDNVDVKGYNIGGYGAFFFDNNLEFKFMFIGARQNYSTIRKINYNNIEKTASGDFDGYALNLAAELGYDYYYRDDLYLRPLFSAEYAYVSTDEFTEYGGKSANLTVYSGSYNRMNTSFGLQVNNGTDYRAKWYAEAKLNFLLAGRYGEFEGEFVDTSNSLTIKGIENDMFSAAIGAGVLYDISKNWSAYANINGLFSGSQTGFYGNIGVNYKFTTTYFDFYER